MLIAEFINKFDEVQDYVLTAPVAIIKDDRVQLFAISVDEYERLVRLASEGGAHSA